MGQKKLAAGLLMHRLRDGDQEVLLAHPGGPLFAKKDSGCWTIPKGEPNDGEEDLLQVAIREFREETGFDAQGPFLPLGMIKQKGGKVVHAWACEGNIDVERLKSNTFTMEWPPRSGQLREFPEVDRAAYFSADAAREKIKEAQWPLVERLLWLQGKGGGAE